MAPSVAFGRIGYGLVLILGIRLCYLLVRYVAGAEVQRFHVESTALLLVIIGAGFRLWRNVPQGAIGSRANLHSPVLLFVLIVLAFALYWPALTIGFLSDDFLLIDRASTWRVGAVTLELFRPLPLTIWALVLELGLGAKTIHALNIVLHATNAWLTAHVASRWVSDRWSALGAGLLMLVMPLAPEAVVWNAGMFDVMATTLVLTVILISRQYATRASLAIRVSLVFVALLALLAKETAAVVPLLILLDAWVRKQFSKKLLQDTAVIFGIVGVVGVVRLVMRFGATAPPLSVRSIRHALFRSFGGLAFPWHSDVVETWPAVPLIAALVISALVIAFFLHRGQRALTKVVFACAAWILIGILPVFHALFISYDLQSSRYLYLSSVAWSVLLVTLITDIRVDADWSRWLAPIVIIALALLSVFGLRMHLKPWIEAANIRDVVEQQVMRNNQMRSCDTVVVTSLPDTVRGAYVFRVGAKEEFKRVLGMNLSVGNTPGSCSFRWDERKQTFLQIEQ